MSTLNTMNENCCNEELKAGCPRKECICLSCKDCPQVVGFRRSGIKPIVGSGLGFKPNITRNIRSSRLRR